MRLTAVAVALAWAGMGGLAAPAGLDCAGLVARAARPLSAEFSGEGRALTVRPDGTRSALICQTARTRADAEGRRFAMTFTFLDPATEAVRLQFVARSNADGSSPSLMALSGAADLQPPADAPVLDTAFVYGDFLFDPGQWRHECAPATGPVEGRPAVIVTSRPPGGMTGEFAERWVDAETGDLFRVRRFDAAGRLAREMEFSGFVEHSGRRWPARMTAIDHGRGLRTMITMKSGRLGPAAP